MKKSYLFLLFLLVSVSISAQDLVETNAGIQYNCYINNVDSSSVAFTYKRDGIKIDTIIPRADVYNFRYSVMEDTSLPKYNAKTCLSLGAGFGGSTYAGFDFEYMLTKKVGVEAGAGYLGLDAGINYHFFPTVRSSYVSFRYWCKGLGGDSKLGYQRSMVGPAITYRGKKWLTFQFGGGYIIEKGPAMPEKSRDFKVALTGSLGIYLPVK